MGEKQAKKLMLKNSFKMSLKLFLLLGLINIGLSVKIIAQNDCKAVWKNFLLDKDSQRAFKLMTCKDTIVAIRALLNFENDTAINMAFSGFTEYLPMYKSDDEINKMTKEHDRIFNKNMAVTNQLAALYIISALYYNNYKFCSRIALQNTKTDKIITNLEYLYQGVQVEYYKTVDNRIIKKIYRNTKKWLKTVERYGLDYVRQNNMPPPIDGFEWYTK